MTIDFYWAAKGYQQLWISHRHYCNSELLSRVTLLFELWMTMSINGGWPSLLTMLLYVCPGVQSAASPRLVILSMFQCWGSNNGRVQNGIPREINGWKTTWADPFHGFWHSRGWSYHQLMADKPSYSESELLHAPKCPVMAAPSYSWLQRGDIFFRIPIVCSCSWFFANIMLADQQPWMAHGKVW